MRLKIAFAIPLFLTTTLMAQNVGAPSLQINKDNRTLSVSASDHAEADAEIADIHIGFTTYGATLPAAYKSASDMSSAIVKTMLDAGAQKSEIQSQSQSVARLQDYEMKTQKGMKFRVQQSWTVSVPPKNAALILDAAIQAGANQSGDINWRMKNSVALDSEAIRRATERARALASALAAGLGVTLGKALYATNEVQGGIVPLNGRNFTALAKISAGVAAPQPLDIEPQRVDRDATVQIVYAIE